MSSLTGPSRSRNLIDLTQANTDNSIDLTQADAEDDVLVLEGGKKIPAGKFRDPRPNVPAVERILPNIVFFALVNGDGSDPNNLRCFLSGLDENYNHVNLPSRGAGGPLHGQSRANIFFSDVVLKARFRPNHGETPHAHRTRLARLVEAEMLQPFTERP